MKCLPDTFAGLTQLTYLIIETASLSSLPDSLGKLGALRELWIIYCHCLQVCWCADVLSLHAGLCSQ